MNTNRSTPNAYLRNVRRTETYLKNLERAVIESLLTHREHTPECCSPREVY